MKRWSARTSVTGEATPGQKWSDLTEEERYEVLMQVSPRSARPEFAGWTNAMLNDATWACVEETVDADERFEQLLECTSALSDKDLLDVLCARVAARDEEDGLHHAVFVRRAVESVGEIRRLLGVTVGEPIMDAIYRVHGASCKEPGIAASSDIVYVVGGATGEHDEYQEWPVRVCADEALAKVLTDRLNAWCVAHDCAVRWGGDKEKPSEDPGFSDRGGVSYSYYPVPFAGALAAQPGIEVTVYVLDGPARCDHERTHKATYTVVPRKSEEIIFDHNLYVVVQVRQTPKVVVYVKRAPSMLVAAKPALAVMKKETT